MKKLTLISLLSLALAWDASAQLTNIYVPSGTIPATGTNVIPFGSSTSFTPGYTFMEVIPAANLAPALATRRVNEVSLAPSVVGSWSSATVQIGLGHVATPHPCPFSFPTFGVTPGIGSFLDFTVIYDSTVNGPFTWNHPVANAWAPMGFAATGGTSFIWNGVDAVAFFITFQNSVVVGTGAFRNSATIPPARTYAAGYNVATSTACNATSGLYICLDMIPSVGVFANFTGAPTTGSAPLAVNFTDGSLTSDPGGITSWAWDVNNDTIIDYTVQNPAHVYTCPGQYTVTLTVTDAVNPPSTITKTNYVSVSQPAFSLVTTGMGVGDLTINAVGTLCYPTATSGYTLVSISTTGPAGFGPFGGLYPDSLTVVCLTNPELPGNPLHFTVTPLTYPNGPTLALPPGTFPATLTLDAIQVMLSATNAIVYLSGVSRVTF